MHLWKINITYFLYQCRLYLNSWSDPLWSRLFHSCLWVKHQIMLSVFLTWRTWSLNSAFYLVSVPPEPLVRQPGQTRETLQQLVGEKHLPRSFVVCTQRGQDTDSAHLSHVCESLSDPTSSTSSVFRTCRWSSTCSVCACRNKTWRPVTGKEQVVAQLSRPDVRILLTH